MLWWLLYFMVATAVFLLRWALTEPQRFRWGSALWRSAAWLPLLVGWAVFWALIILVSFVFLALG